MKKLVSGSSLSLDVPIVEGKKLSHVHPSVRTESNSGNNPKILQQDSDAVVSCPDDRVIESVMIERTSAIDIQQLGNTGMEDPFHHDWPHW